MSVFVPSFVNVSAEEFDFVRVPVCVSSFVRVSAVEFDFDSDELSVIDSEIVSLDFISSRESVASSVVELACSDSEKETEAVVDFVEVFPVSETS